MNALLLAEKEIVKTEKDCGVRFEKFVDFLAMGAKFHVPASIQLEYGEIFNLLGSVQKTIFRVVDITMVAEYKSGWRLADYDAHDILRQNQKELQAEFTVFLARVHYVDPDGHKIKGMPMVYAFLIEKIPVDRAKDDLRPWLVSFPHYGEDSDFAVNIARWFGLSRGYEEWVAPDTLQDYRKMNRDDQLAILVLLAYGVLKCGGKDVPFAYYAESGIKNIIKNFVAYVKELAVASHVREVERWSVDAPSERIEFLLERGRYRQIWDEYIARN